MRDERTCVICGEHYSYCPNCVDYNNQPRWRFLFHDKNCHDIYGVLNDYGASVITKDQARAKLRTLDLTNLNAFRKDFRDQINEIMQSPSTAAVKIKPYATKGKVK